MSGLGLALLNDPTSTASPTLQQFLSASDCPLHDTPAISTNLTGPDSQDSPVCHGAMATSAPTAGTYYTSGAAAGDMMQLMSQAAVASGANSSMAMFGSHGMPATALGAAAAAMAAAADGKKGSKAGKGAAKSGRRGVPKSQIVCKVDGCHQVLSSSKAYYQRHRVCAVHLAAMSAMVDGVESRFCQQCGKFQPLEEFDADKRSCRTRLKRHNNRRREQRHNKSNDPLSSLFYSERHQASCATLAAVADAKLAAASAAAAAGPAAIGSGGSSHLSPRASPKVVGTTAGSSGTPNTAGDENSSHIWTLCSEATPSPHSHSLSQQAGGASGGNGHPVGMSSHSTSSVRRPQMRRSSANRALEALRSLNASSTSTASDFDDDYDDTEERARSPGAPAGSRQKKKPMAGMRAPHLHHHQQQQQQFQRPGAATPGLGSPALYGMQPAQQVLGPPPVLSRFAPFGVDSRTVAGQQQWEPQQQQQQQWEPQQQQQQATVFGGIAGAAAAAAACFADAGVTAAEGVTLLPSMAAQHSAPTLMGQHRLAHGSSGAHCELRADGHWEGSCPAAVAGMGDTSTLVPTWSLAGSQQQASAAATAAAGRARQVSSGGGQNQQQHAEDSSSYRLCQRQKLQHHEQEYAPMLQQPQQPQQLPVVGDGSCGGGGRLSYSSAGSGGYHQPDSRAVATFQAEIRRDSQQAAMRVVSSSDELFRQQQQRYREQQQQHLGMPHPWDLQLQQQQQQQQHVDLSRSQSYSSSLPPLQGGHSHSSGGGLTSAAAAAAPASVGSGSFILARRERSSSPGLQQQHLLVASSGGSGSNGGRTVGGGSAGGVPIPGLPSFNPQMPPAALQPPSISAPGMAGLMPGQILEHYNPGTTGPRLGQYNQGGSSGGGFVVPGTAGFGGLGARGHSCSDLTSGLSGSALGTATTSGGGGGDRWSQQGNQASSGGLVVHRAGSMSCSGAAADSPSGSSVLRGDLAGIHISNISSGGSAAAAAAAWEEQQQQQPPGHQDPCFPGQEPTDAAAAAKASIVAHLKVEACMPSPFEQEQGANGSAAACNMKSWLDSIPSPSPKGGVTAAGLVPAAPLLQHQQQQPAKMEQPQQQQQQSLLHLDQGLPAGARASAPGCLYPSHQMTITTAVGPATAASAGGSCGGAGVSAFAAAAYEQPRQQSVAADCATTATAVAAATEHLLGGTQTSPATAAAAAVEDPSPSFVINGGAAAAFGGSDVFRGMSGDEDFGELLDLLLESNS